MESSVYGHDRVCPEFVIIPSQCFETGGRQRVMIFTLHNEQTLLWHDPLPSDGQIGPMVDLSAFLPLSARRRLHTHAV